MCQIIVNYHGINILLQKLYNRVSLFNGSKCKKIDMAKYSKKAQDKVEKVMHEYKEGKLKSGPKGKGGKVRSRKQAIAIGISEARQSGAKVPKRKSSK
jgi:hypothetical protein